MLGLFAYYDYSSQIELYRFDIDKNGLFTSDETSAKGFGQASRNYISDTPRIFIPMISFMFSAMFSIPILIIGLLIEKLKKNSAKLL